MVPTPFKKQLSLATHLSQNQQRFRYAPSPTGAMHLGNIRTALLSWLQARLSNGVFILRMEDLDIPRVQNGSAEQIMEDLRWLGIDWDEGPDIGGPVGPYNQSERTKLYENALDFLANKHLIYPCYCSRRDIAEAASAPHNSSAPGAQSAPLIYPGTCRTLTPSQQAQIHTQKPNKTPAFRYRVPNDTIIVDDSISGAYSQRLDIDVGDFVVRRSDALFAYQLAVVVDDALMGITDVLRGEDLLDSTPRQIALYRSLGFPVPKFYHVPLMVDVHGEKLSKRDGSDSLVQLRTQGYGATEIIGELAASLGLIDTFYPLHAIDLLEAMTIKKFHQTLASPSTAPMLGNTERD